MKELLPKSENTESLERIIPTHIAIIMDGNRRWAKNKNFPSMFGHREGVQALKKITRYANDFLGVKHLTVYAFSTENWNRKKDEVDFLMFLVQDALQREIDEMHKENVRIRFIGFYDALPAPLPRILIDAMDKTKNNTGINLNVALNYGSRAEISYAVKEIAKKTLSGEIKPDNITPELISENLMTKDIPDPDLLIRTGGEQRISNYLLWQCAYTEFYSTEVLWPAFDTSELEKAINEFNKRQRRFGV